MSEEAKLLGKSISYPKSYSPEILVAVPRSLNREIYGIYEPDKLFCGYDVWHAYEASFLLNNGMPITGILKIVYLSTSKFIVESKSLKLYLGSYNMTSLGKNPEEGIAEFTQTIEKDLGCLLETPVKVYFHKTTPSLPPNDFSEFEILENKEYTSDLRFSIYQEHPLYLSENITTVPGELKVGSHLLKSNCKITSQPDWGTIYIHLKANRTPAPVSLLKYIVSLRNENHFHEEICEMVYQRLYELFQPEILVVTCLYTRRGGIDICPSRSSHPQYLPSHLLKPETLTTPAFRQ